MKKNALRIVALVLSVIMTLGAMTVVSFADGETVGTSLHVDPVSSPYTTWLTTFDAVTLPDGYNTIKYDYTMKQLVDGKSPGYHSTRVFARNADGAFVYNNDYGCHGIGGDLAYVDGFVSGTATVSLDLNSIRSAGLTEFGVLIRGNRAAVYTFSNVRATNGTDEILLSADGGQKYAPDYLYDTDAKKFVATVNVSPIGGYGFSTAYSFKTINLNSVNKLTVDLTINAPVDNMLIDGPGYHSKKVYLWDSNGNNVVANINIPGDAFGKFSIDIDKASFSESQWFDARLVDRIEFDLCTNREALYSLDSVKFDGVEVDDLAIVGMTQGAINTADMVAGNGYSFSFETPVDMSAQTSLSYFKTYYKTSATETPGLHRGRIALTDVDGKIYMLDNAATGHSHEAYESIVSAGVQYTSAISADAAAAIGFDLSKVVQVDFYFAHNRECAVRIHRLTLSDGTKLFASNSDLYYGATANADLAINAKGEYNAIASGTFEFTPVDVTKFSTLKVNFTPINVTAGANTKIGDGPYMWKLVYTLTSSTGASVEIKSTKDNIGDLHGTQLETLAVAGLEDVASITVTLNGNKTASYFFDFSFVNGEGVEKAAVSAEQNILMVGHQRSTELVNNKMGLRFVAAIENIEGYSEIGFDVASTGKVTVPVSGKSVYTSVLGEDGTYYALDNYGYNYLYALEINNVDTTLGTLEFEVTPWAMVNGEKVTFASMTVVYDGANCVK